MRAKFSTVKGSAEVTLIADNDPDRVMLSDVFMCSSNERRSTQITQQIIYCK